MAHPAKLRVTAMVACLLLGLLLTGCAASLSDSVAPSRKLDTAGLPRPKSLPGDWPLAGAALPELPRSASAAAQLSIGLADSTAQHNSVLLGESLVLSAGSSGLAYAAYAVPAPVPDVDNIALAGSDGLWLLLADFATGRWAVASECQGGVALASFDGIQQPLNDQGFAFCAIVAPAGLQGTVTTLQLSYDGPAHFFYVSPPQQGGDDSADGSYYHPWATMQHAADSVLPDTVVRVRAGTYNEFVLNKGGAEGQPVAFLAEVGAIITRSAGPVDFGINMGAEPVSYLVLDGFSVQDFDVQCVGLGFVNKNCSDITVRNLICSSSSQAGMSASNINNLTIEDCQVTLVTGGSGIELNGCPDCVVRGCAVAGTSGSSYTFWYCSGALIEDNQSLGNTAGYGFWYYGAGSNVTIRHNTVINTDDDGIRLESDFSVPETGLQNFIVSGNRINCQGVTGGMGLRLLGVQDCALRNNLIYGFNNGGVYVDASPQEPSSELHFINNTVVQFNDGGGADTAKVALTMDDGVSDVELRNNIFVAPNNVIALQPSTLVSMASENNLFSGALLLNTTPYDLPTWTSSFNLDTASAAAAANGIFANLAASDFHLFDGSPAAGLADPAFTPAGDIDGALRNQDGSADAGCFEFSL